MLLAKMMLFEQFLKRAMPSLPVKFGSWSGRCEDGAGPEILFLVIMFEFALSSSIGNHVSILLSDIRFDEPSRLMPPSTRVFPLIVLAVPLQRIAGPLMLMKLLFSISTNEESLIAIPAGVPMGAVPLMNTLQMMLICEELEILTPAVHFSIFKRVMVTLFRPAMIMPLFPASREPGVVPIQLAFP